MDVVRLGPPGSSDYVPDEIIEGYTSLVWTERFQDPGEFELKTPLISETLNLLPEMTLISTRQTKEVMMVESRLIEVNAEGQKELTVKGRSLTAFFEHRHVEGGYGKRRKMAKNYSAINAAAVLIWNAVDNWSGKDVTREGDWPWTDKDKIPNVSVSDSAPATTPSRRWWLEQGPLYPQLYNILVKGDLGLRTIRPVSDRMTRMTIETALATRGNVTREVIEDVTSLRFDLYSGLDRTDTQSTNPRVVFNYLQDHIDSESYLFSNKELKTACEVMTGVGGADVYRGGDASLTGLSRRVMSYDGGEPEYKKDKPTYPGKNASAADQTKYESDLAEWQTEKAQIDAEFKADAEDDALRALKKQRRVSLFSGDISPLAPYVYKTHYDLGDLVTLRGDYNQSEKMIVSEYIRTEDAEGDRGYPGLILP